MTAGALTPGLNRCHVGDCRQVMRALVAEGVRAQTIVTSPPYFGLRDYGMAGQIGLEPTVDDYVAQIVDVFRTAHRLLADDGTLWLNLGDSYAGSWGAQGKRETPAEISRNSIRNHPKRASNTGTIRSSGLKPKDLIGIPWRVAFALQADGWYLRQGIVWHKPNPMPESVTDRCTTAHEFVFLLSKSPSYYCDMDAIREPVTTSTVSRLAQNVDAQAGSTRLPGKTNGPMKAVGGARSRRDSFKRDGSKRDEAIVGQSVGTHRPDRDESDWPLDSRNKRSVWTVPTTPYSGAHFAVMPEELAETCILAGSRPGDIVFDPFMGSGTVAAVSQRLGRYWLGAELNPDYLPLQAQRTRQGGLVLQTA
jgi:DNA modification methylase